MRLPTLSPTMQSSAQAQVPAQARVQRAQPSIASSARSSSRSATPAPSSFLAYSIPSSACHTPSAPRSPGLGLVWRVERIEALLAATDVKGGLGTGGNRVMGATGG